MANQLGMAMRHSILVLKDRGWSHRRIARELGIHRETVSRYLGLSRGEPAPAHPPPEPSPKPAIPITGSGHQDSCCDDPILGVVESKPAISIAGSAGRASLCAPYVEIILGMLEDGLSAQRIWQDLASDHGFADGYQSVQRFVRRLQSKRPLPFRRMESAPGEQAQVDFGTGAPVITPKGQPLPIGVKTHRRKTHVFSRWRIERLFEDTKDELGMDHFEVRRYVSIQRHLILTCVSHLFLAEFRLGHGGKKRRPDHRPTADGDQNVGTTVDSGPAVLAEAGENDRRAIDRNPSAKRRRPPIAPQANHPAITQVWHQAERRTHMPLAKKVA